jgi:Cellulose binding domain
MPHQKRRRLRPATLGLIVGTAMAAVVTVIAGSSLASTSATPQKATGACAAIYEVESEWPAGATHGFQADIQIVNLTGSVLTSWSFGWTFPNDQKIYQSWGADFTQSGAAVTANSEPNEGWIGANGGRFHIGFLGNVGATNAVPTAFTFNGNSCPLVNDALEIVGSTTAAAPSGATTVAAGGAATGGAPSAPAPAAPAATTPAAPGGGCAAIYEIESQWPTATGHAFLGDIQIINTTGAALTSWAFTWTFPGDQSIYQSWGADFEQSGAQVTANSEPNEGFIAANGGAFHIGFLANVGNTNAVPGNFALNGTPCPLREG